MRLLSPLSLRQYVYLNPPNELLKQAVGMSYYCPYKLFLWQLPGVDPNDPSVQEMLASLRSQSEVSL